MVTISSIAGRVARSGYGVYSFTTFGVNGFTESLRQETTQRQVRVGVLAPEDIAEGIAYLVTRPRHTAIGPWHRTFQPETNRLICRILTRKLISIVRQPVPVAASRCYLIQML